MPIIAKRSILPATSAAWVSLLLTTGIVLVWVVNGLYCKILDGVPRHEMIVARILGDTYAAVLTKAIGISELLMAVWILSRIAPRLCAITQIVIVMLMNVLELLLAPDLLLFGRLNIVWASVFCAVVYLNEFVIRPGRVQAHVPLKSF